MQKYEKLVLSDVGKGKTDERTQTMSYKTTVPAAIMPVLSNPQCETEEDIALFADNLARWCEQWVPTISVPIMRKAQELYDDTAVCILLGKWYDLKLKATKDMHERLLRAANNDERRWEQEGHEAEYDYPSSFDCKQLSSYNDALRALLIG